MSLQINQRDREKLIDPLYQTDWRFYAVVAALLVIIAWSVVMYVRQLTLGLGETGLGRPVFWGIYMVNFIFLIGVSMAGTLISAMLQLTQANWRRPITRIAEALTVFGLLVAALQIFFDMGRPERGWAVIRYGRLQSPLLWDATSMTLYILTSMFALYLQLLPDLALLRDNFPESGPNWRQVLYTRLALGWRGNRTQWLRLEKTITVVAVLIIPIGVSLHTVTSWIFSTTVQPGWKSTILGPYFVIGAIFSGIGLLFITLTIFRQQLGLESYIKELQYRNLGWLFIVMSVLWFYFTYNEMMVLTAGQEVMEFPVLASKLWGTYASSFWGMVVLMILAFWIMTAPLLLPVAASKAVIFQPRVAFPFVAAAVFLTAVLLKPAYFPNLALIEQSQVRFGVWVLVAIGFISGGVTAALWFKPRIVVRTVTASVFVVAAMWLERWNIIIPTVTHPRLIPYATYTPSLTEIAIMAGSFSLLALMTLLFFKLFPVISIWEIAEGRVVDAAQAQVHIPLPEASAAPTRRQLRRERQTSGD